MDSLHKLEEHFSHFPGIGPRQAKRFVYYLLNKPSSFISEFTSLINEVKKSTLECAKCHRFFSQNNSKSNISQICSICSDPNRDQTTIMILARDSDFETVERSRVYNGLYFILGGTIPLMDKEPEKRIRLKSLLEYIPTLVSLSEIILSLNTTPDGENTSDIVNNALQKIINLNKTKLTLLGRGLSTGSELEYVDSETIRNALRNRA